MSELDCNGYKRDKIYRLFFFPFSFLFPETIQFDDFPFKMEPISPKVLKQQFFKMADAGDIEMPEYPRPLQLLLPKENL